MLLALIGVSMPNFWFGIMLILVFAATLKWLPSANFTGFKSLILPAITLSANSLAMITRMTRSSMLETIRQDYIRTARAKGHKEFTVIVRHALRNALIPVVTTTGLQFGFAIGGAVLVETVFSWPGIGRLLVETIKFRDTPTVMAIVLIIAIMFSVINLCIDILYAFLDPRIRAQY
jgi:peptide/nickel transport system permease protein